MTPLRVVLDTNVVIMPVVREYSQDSPLRDMWQNGTIQPLVSEETEAEFRRKLADPRFQIPEELRDATANVYLAHCTKVQIPRPPPDIPECRDQEDEMLLTLAYQAVPDYLVTRDPDLHAMAQNPDITLKIPIIRSGELYRMMHRRSLQRRT